MKKNPFGRVSSNVIDRRMDTSAQAPHTSDPNGNDIINESKLRQRDEWMDAVTPTMRKIQQKPNPFRDTIVDMQTLPGRMKKQTLIDHKAGKNSRIPIPTPKPDPRSKAPKIPPGYSNDKG